MTGKNELTLMCGTNTMRYQTNKRTLEDAFHEFTNVCQRNGIDISNVDFACATLRDQKDGSLVSVDKDLKAPAHKLAQASRKYRYCGYSGRTSVMRANFWR